MAKPKRKAAKPKPVTQHLLFPAVVALWFGALFGLGSLAVRPSLLEELVIKSRIDLLIPAAAPPLGMTARMLVALFLAAFGALIGAAIAQRIARSGQEVRERKRTNLSTRDEGVRIDASRSYADASTHNPAPAVERTVAAATPGVLAGRRRSLAIEHEQGEFVPHDMAPLPGGAPQIFDIAAAGLGDAPAEPIAPPEPGHYFVPDPRDVAEPPPAPVALDWANAAPVLPPVAGMAPAPIPQSIEAQRQVFHPVGPVSAPAVIQPASEDGRQVFGMAQPATPPRDQPRQIFGAPVADDHVPKELGEARGFRSSVFAMPEPSPLFTARAETPPAEEPMADPPAVQAAPEAGQPDPASLAIDDLSARLAESMRRRRAARADTAAPTAAEPAATAEFSQPSALEAHAPALVPQAYEPAPVVPAQAPDPIPAALRPLDLSGFEQDDLDEYDSLLPPRRIAFPVAPTPVAPAAFAPPVAAPADDEAEISEEVVAAEENYASLLGVTPSPASLRNPFVRVEEPEANADSFEPVVIFPGQSVPSPQPFAAHGAASGAEATPFRRFDAPASAGHGQPVAANETAGSLPPEETEHALRSALANLQRMGGAA